MPTFAEGLGPSTLAGVMGFSVFRQTPYKGDAHTENALRVACFLTHPVHLARSQLRRFRHLPPEPKRLARIYPELTRSSDPWVKFYNDVMDSDIPWVAEPMTPGTPATRLFMEYTTEFDVWLEKKGMSCLEQVVYQRLTPTEGARLFYEGVRQLVQQVPTGDSG